MLNLFKKLPAQEVRAKLFSTIFAFLLLFIVSVSAIDVYWSIHNQDELMKVEKNPLGRYLMNMDDGSIGLFMASKLMGTVFVCCTLICIYIEKNGLGRL